MDDDDDPVPRVEIQLGDLEGRLDALEQRFDNDLRRLTEEVGRELRFLTWWLLALTAAVSGLAYAVIVG